MFCPGCGKHNPDQARYCRHCGSHLPDLTTETTGGDELELLEVEGEFVGKTLGRYRVLKKLHYHSVPLPGDFDESKDPAERHIHVYRALDTQLDRIVVLEVIPAELSKNKGMIEDLRDEINLAAGLEHANILPVHDFGRFGDNYFVVLKHADGQSLARHIEKRAPLLPLEVLRIGIQISSAITYLHKRFIIHGRIAASGFILQDSGHVILRDMYFLSSPHQGEHDDAHQVRLERTANERLYQAPEISLGQDADARSDIYSIGALLYHLLTGHPPYTAQVDEVEEEEQLTTRGIPVILEELLFSMLKKNPEDRVGSVEEVREQLRQSYSLSITSLSGEEQLEGEFIDFTRLSVAQENDHRQTVEGLLIALGGDIHLSSLSSLPSDDEALTHLGQAEPAPKNSIARLSFYNVLDDTLNRARSGDPQAGIEILKRGLELSGGGGLTTVHFFLTGVAERERRLKRARFILGNNLITEFRRAAESYTQALRDDPNCLEAQEGLNALSEVSGLWQTHEAKKKPRWLLPVVIGVVVGAIVLAMLLFTGGTEPGKLGNLLTDRGLPPGGLQPSISSIEEYRELPFPVKPVEAPIFAGDIVLIPTDGSELVAYSLLNKEELWRLEGVSAGYPPLVYSDEVIAISGSDLVIFDEEHKLASRYELGARPAAPLALSREGTLYAANEQGTIFAFDLSTPGRFGFIWSINFGSRPAGLYPAPAGKRLLVVFTDGQVALFDGFNGGELWYTRLPIDGTVPTSAHPRPLIAGETIYFCVEDRALALAVADGQPVWEQQLSSAVLGNPALHEGSLFITDLDGQLFRLRAEDGEVAGHWDLEADLALERPLICGTELLLRRGDGLLVLASAASLTPIPSDLPTVDYPPAIFNSGPTDEYSVVAVAGSKLLLFDGKEE